MHAWVMGSDSTLISTSDGGKTWTAQPNAYGHLVQGVAGTVWGARCSDGRLSHSEDGGVSWTASSTDFPQIASLSFADATHGWLVGWDGLLMYTDDGGTSWQQEDVGSDLFLTSVAAADATTAWIQTSDGAILSTATAGR